MSVVSVHLSLWLLPSRGSALGRGSLLGLTSSHGAVGGLKHSDDGGPGKMAARGKTAMPQICFDAALPGPLAVQQTWAASRAILMHQAVHSMDNGGTERLGSGAPRNQTESTVGLTPSAIYSMRVPCGQCGCTLRALWEGHGAPNHGGLKRRRSGYRIVQYTAPRTLLFCWE